MLAVRHPAADEFLRARVERRLAAAPNREPVAVLRALALALLPTEAESRTGTLVSVAFVIRGLTHAELAEAFRHGFGEFVAQVREQFVAGQRSGAVDPAWSPQREAHILLALVGGLTSGVLAGQLDPAAAIEIVDYHLARLAA